MKVTILLILMLAVGACTEEVSPQEAITPSDESRGMIDIENVRTYEDLRFYLDQRYGEVEELLVEAVISSGVDTTVPYRYRLEGGRELTVPIIFTASSERIVDPDFDLESALD